MIGSPASRGAVASVAAAVRTCFALAAGVRTVVAVNAAVTIAENPQRRTATKDSAVISRCTIPCPGVKYLRSGVMRQIAIIGLMNRRHQSCGHAFLYDRQPLRKRGIRNTVVPN